MGVKIDGSEDRLAVKIDSSDGNNGERNARDGMAVDCGQYCLVPSIGTKNQST
jgi:hypothetical protein